MSVNQRPGGHLVFFLIGHKNTHVMEDVEILLPVKFLWIAFSGIREEVRGRGGYLVCSIGMKT